MVSSFSPFFGEESFCFHRYKVAPGDKNHEGGLIMPKVFSMANKKGGDNRREVRKLDRDFPARKKSMADASLRTAEIPQKNQIAKRLEY